MNERRASRRGECGDSSPHSMDDFLGGFPEFARVVAGMRRLQDAVTAARPSPQASRVLAARIDALEREFRKYEVEEARQIAGRCTDFAGRGQMLVPPVYWEGRGEVSMDGYVEFSRFYLGADGAVHGGALPLLFDEAMAEVASRGRIRCRTAYLHVNYRRITPVEEQLRVEVQLFREEGRKRFVEGRLYRNGCVVSDAHALFVELREHQE